MPCGSHALVASIIALAMPPASAACYWPVLRCCACGCMSLFADICKRSVPRPRARVLSRHCAEICTKLRRFRLARVWGHVSTFGRILPEVISPRARVGPWYPEFSDSLKKGSRPRACGAMYSPVPPEGTSQLAPARVWVRTLRHHCREVDNLHLAPARVWGHDGWLSTPLSLTTRARARVGSALQTS